MKPDSLARRGRKRRPPTMPVRTLSRILSAAISKLEDDILASTDREETRRIASALATISGVYAKVQQTAGLEEEVEQIRGELAEVRKEINANRAKPRHNPVGGSGPKAPDVN